MRGLIAAAIAVVTGVVITAVFGGPTGPSGSPEPSESIEVKKPARIAAAREDCSTRSEASFPAASDPRNLVVGPLVLVGGAFTDARTVREFGGNKFPLLVAAGHTVTLRVARAARGSARLAYGPLPQGRRIRLRDAHRSVTFIACRPGKAPRDYSPNGPSSSDAGGVAVTFWSGFVLTRAPACVPLEVYVDAEPSPRRAGLALGRRCNAQR